MDVRLPNGQVIRNVPDGTSKTAIMRKAVNAGLAKYEDFADKSDPMLDPTGTFGENFQAGIGKAFVDAGRGVSQLVGMGDQQAIDEAKIRDAALMKTGGGIVGNIAGNVALTAAPARLAGMAGTALSGVLPRVGGAITAGANALVQPSSVGQALASGAALGAIQPIASDESRLANMVLGAASAGISHGLTRGASRVVQPQTDDAARLLMSKGVTPTAGQIAGGAAQRVEQGLTSVPVLGDAIKSGQYKAVEQLNRAAGNEALAPLGRSLPKSVKAGREMISYIGDTLSDAYARLTPRLGAVVDDGFKADISKLNTMASQLPKDKARQLQNIIKEQITKKLSPNGGMAGETLKEVESELGSLARRYIGSMDPDQQTLGRGIQEVQTALRNMVARQNPNAAKELAKINAGWARLARLETAAGRVGSREGVFSPEALLGAVKIGDYTVRDRAFARGDALLQDLAEAGVKTLGRTVPDSGTPFRLMAAGGLGGLAGYIEPGTAAALGAGSVAYGTDMGRRIMAGLLSQRPAMFAPIGAGIDALAPTAGLLGGAAYPALQ